MKELDMSQFKMYSFGRVADNKARSSKTINVTPIENASMISGEIASNEKEMVSKGVDASGNHYQTSVVADTAIEAEWLPFGSNRVTAPDVRRGERVMIWQYADTDAFYWTTTGWDDALRRLETVVYAFSNNSKVDGEGFNPKDYYFVEVSTHDKHIILRTSKADGEPFEYGFVFDTKNGIVTLADDAGNLFELNSKDTKMSMVLNTGTKVILDKQKILIEAIMEIKMKVGNNVMTMTPSLLSWIAKKFTWKKG